MATIITINAADKLNPDSRNNINTNFAALNAELITKLPLAGGTMTGDLNMDSKKITNLPAPVANAEPARKVEVDGKVSLTGAETIAGVKTFSSAPVVPAATWGRADVKAGRRVSLLFGVCKTATTYLRLSDVAAAHTMRMRRAGCIVGISIYGAAVDVQASQAYVGSGTAAAGRFADGDRISFTRNISTGICAPTINATSVTNLIVTSSAADDLFVVIEFELDD